jgi:GH25 family lysozyme M1 (1,4-beta-N-acetylmuramidase)
MNQVRVVDINVYYRTGGVDWTKLKANFDAVIISAGVGLWANPMLREQVDGAIAHDVPYCTYHIPSPAAGSLREQADFYLRLPGVRDATTCIDIEAPNRRVRCVTNPEALAYIQHIEDVTGSQPLVYSNPNIIHTILADSEWLFRYWLWVAQYYWQIGFPLYLKFTDFDSFLARFSNAYPSGVRNTPLQTRTVLWQFTDKGSAQELCANVHTNDPVYANGIQSCDLNVSTVDRAQFLSLLGVTSPSPEPPPQPIGVWYRITVPDRNIRITPNSLTGKVIITLHRGDIVLVDETVNGLPGVWGEVTAYKQRNMVTPSPGYV